MRRVLMISPHFPPDTSAGTHRVRLLAPHLPAFGWEPTVVTVDPVFYEGRLDPDLAGLVPPSVRVLRAPAWPASMTRPFGLGDLGLRALRGLGRLCRTVLSHEAFDALFITLYPTYPAVLGPRLKARFNLPFVLDYQDPWVGAWGCEVGGAPDGSADFKSRLTRALAVRIEPRVVRHADALTAVSALTYEDVLARVPDARPRTCAAIPLGYEVADVEALRRAPRPNRWFTPGDGVAHVCYVGTVLPTGGPVLRAVLESLRVVRDRAPRAYANLRLHFLGTSNQRDPAAHHRVVPLAAAIGVADAIEEVPPRLDYLDALNVQMQATALLLMGSVEPHYTPSKVFPALLSGRPLVAVYHEQSTVLDLLRAPGVDASVAAFADASAAAAVPVLAAALERLASSPAVPSRPSPPALVEPWSARALAGRLGTVLDAVAA
jgi:hypothetical protein